MSTAATPGPLALIDATAVPADRSGVGRYVDGLVSRLTGPIAIACQRRDGEHYAALAPTATILPQPTSIESIPRRFIWEQIELPRLARRLDARVIHSPHYTMPLLTSRRRVVTFHDATFFSDPSVHSRLKGIFFRTWIRLSARLADAVIVPSRATGEEVAHYTRRGSAWFDVVYHGVDLKVFHPPSYDEVQGMRQEQDLPRHWIAFLGTLEPRKNVPALIRAYGRAATVLEERAIDVPMLVLAGAQGWETGVEAALGEIKAPASVRRLGFVPLHSLRAVLGGAQVVVYPSLGEGFGLPVLEAMACRTAVLTTRRLALPEVGGDAVAYTETDVDAIADALLQLLSDPAQRDRLAAAGFARAGEFTWQATADRHREVFARVGK